MQLKEFIETRVAMLKTELRQKLAHWKIAAPLAGAGIVLLGTASILITLGLVALAAVFIGEKPIARSLPSWGGGLWAVLGGIAVYIAKRIRAEQVDAAEDSRSAQRRQGMAAERGEDSSMSTLALEVLELRALEQRRQLHKTASDLRGKIQGAGEQLRLEKQVREQLLSFSVIAGLLVLPPDTVLPGYSPATNAL